MNDFISDNVGMDYGINMCAGLLKRRCKMLQGEGKEPPDGRRGSSEYLGKIMNDTRKLMMLIMSE